MADRVLSLKYTNKPHIIWRGVPLREHDPVAMKAIENSTAIRLTSNTVEIVVER